MDTSGNLSAIEQLLQPWALRSNYPEDNRLDVYVTPANLKATVKALVEAHWGYLAAITGLDQPPAPPQAEEATPAEPGQEGEIEVIYHFCHKALVVSLRVSVPYSAAKLPSVCDLIPSATLYERELMEMVGVQLVGTPSSDRLLLPDEWPENVFPLRKSFTGLNSLPKEQDGEA